MDTIDALEQLCNSAEIAIGELQKVLEEEIITGDPDDLTADKLKTAASAKKLAFFDSLDIMDKIRETRDKIEELKAIRDGGEVQENNQVEEQPKRGGFAERHASKKSS